MSSTPHSQIWLEVQNVRLLLPGNTIEVQLRGDKDHAWLPTKAAVSSFATVFEAMDKKRPVHACLTAGNGGLEVGEVAILFAEPQR
ncbi:MAG TPA: hypothetical protein VF432_30050 [Thermoanaerobaculia bacterium]